MERVTQSDEVQVNEAEATRTAEQTEEYKAKKREAAKRFNEKQKQRKEELNALVKEIADNADVYNSLSEKSKQIIQSMLNPVKATSSKSMQFFYDIFGDDPHVGDAITLLDYMKKTLKSKAELDKAVASWADKGIVVETEDAANLFELRYVIKQLPNS